MQIFSIYERIARYSGRCGSVAVAAMMAGLRLAFAMNNAMFLVFAP